MQMIKFLFGDPDFYKKLFLIASPIVVQNLVASALNMVDTIMVGQLGETEIAAVGLANQYFFILNLFLFGICSGSAIFTAQYWGKRDLANIKRVLGVGLLSGIIISFLFTVLAQLFPKSILSIFSRDEAVIQLGSQYLRIAAFSYIVTAITFTYAFVLRSTEKVKVPMFISITALSVNTLFNYLLIFGKVGFPAMGVEGAALATVIARFVEVIFILVIVYRKGYAPAAKLSEMLDVSFDFVKRFFKTTVPVILNESLWAIGVTLYSIVYARMGTEVIASINIFSTVERISMVLFMGMANAAAVMLGNRIGAGDEEKAFDYAKRFALLGPTLGMVTGLFLILTSDVILSVYNVSYVVYEGARKVLMIYSLLMAAKIFNTINIVGILRSGGDTRYGLMLDTVGVWFIAVPLAFIGGLVLKYPVHTVYALVSVEELFKFVLGVKRMVSKKWINNLVSHTELESAC